MTQCTFNFNAKKKIYRQIFFANKIFEIFICKRVEIVVLYRFNYKKLFSYFLKQKMS
jgi:hypothetical protein